MAISEAKKSSNDIMINETMSDDELVASDIPRGTCYTSLYEEGLSVRLENNCSFNVFIFFGRIFSLTRTCQMQLYLSSQLYYYILFSTVPQLLLLTTLGFFYPQPFLPTASFTHYSWLLLPRASFTHRFFYSPLLAFPCWPPPFLSSICGIWRCWDGQVRSDSRRFFGSSFLVLWCFFS